MERKWWTLIVVCVATFMLLLDITIVNVALPKIATDLKASFSDIQWVIDAYALTLASVLLTDRLARRPARPPAGVRGRARCCSAVTSLLCALSPSALFLILARGGQGIGGAIMFATSLALLAQEFHGRERGTAFGVWGATIAAAAAVGPLLGGVLTQAFGWASIFYINVPIGVAAVVADPDAQVAESRNPEGTRIDWIGTVTFTGALFLLVFAIDPGHRPGLGEQRRSSGCLAASAAAAGGLPGLAGRAGPTRCSTSALFRKPTFSGASVVAFARLLFDVRDVPLPDAVPADDPRLLAAADRVCASCPSPSCRSSSRP